MILVVDMNWKRNSLAKYEFVLPIVAVAETFEECRVVHFADVSQKDLDDCSRVILSGTALKDHTTLKDVGKFSWLGDFEKPMLGICAGMQTISLAFVVPLAPCLQIGMSEISTTNQNPLFSGDFKAYCLHNYSVEENGVFEVLAKSSRCIQAIKHRQKNIYGVLFHPEVRNREILENFCRL
jgi:GMP synthase-like glutamine amidotransferase